MKIGSTKIDPQAVAEGVWTEFVLKGPDRTPVEISLKMAFASVHSNPIYKTKLRAGMTPFERLLSMYEKASEIPEVLAKKINDAGMKVFAECIVTDWKGPTGNDGQPAPYSPEGLTALFEEYPELREQAQVEAAKHERYRVKVLEAAAGN